MDRSEISIPIVRAKMYRPAVPSDLLSRGRLLSMMDQSIGVPLTLVSAPAGYGKSVLVSDWLQQQKRDSVWISMDASDSDPRQLLQYLTTALMENEPEACRETRALLKLPEALSLRVTASHLLNDLHELNSPVIFAFDDYHLIDAASPVHKLVELLLEHPSPHVSLILITRRDPPLPLARFRARNQVLEVRLQDLQFSQDEAQTLLAGITGYEASESSIRNLDQELEGWGAGLRLVSLAMRYCENSEEFLQSLSGGIPEIQTYLLGEVLAALPAATSSCMLKTAALDRFCASLVVGICQSGREELGEGNESGEWYIDELLQCNLFTIPLGSDGEWFRFHHLFQDLLQTQAAQQYSPEELAGFKIRASEWFEQNGLITDAIKYAISAGDHDRAEFIIEKYRLLEFEADRWYVLAKWMEMLPPQMRDSTPGLLLCQALIAHWKFDLESIFTILDKLDSLGFSEALTPLMQAEVAHHKCAICYWSGNIKEAAVLNENALALYPAEPCLLRGEMLVYHGIIQQGLGRKQAGKRMVLGEIARGDEQSHALKTRVYAAVTFMNLLSADSFAVLNNTAPFKQAAVKAKTVNAEAWADYTVGIAHLQALSFDEAIQSFSRVNESRDFFELIGARDNAASLVLALQLSKQPKEAQKAVDDLAGYASSLGDPDCFAIADACRARLALAQGRPESALSWARELPLELLAPEMFFFQEFPAMTQMRVFITAGNRAMVQQAESALSVLQPELERLNNRCHLIETMVLRSVALYRLDDQQAAQLMLEEALELAVQGNWLRAFVEPGPLMGTLLNRLPANHRHKKAITRILKVLDVSFAGNGLSRNAPTSAPALIASDDLTNRERDILELLAQRLQNKEIANQLCISTHTVKDHLKHIYQKLNVSNRRQAVAHSIEIGVIRNP